MFKRYKHTSVEFYEVKHGDISVKIRKEDKIWQRYTEHCASDL